MFNISHLGAKLNGAVPIQYRAYALVCEIVPLGFVLWALWSLRQVFANYARGEVFTAEPLRPSQQCRARAVLGRAGRLRHAGADLPSCSTTLTGRVTARSRSASAATTWRGSSSPARVLVIARVMAEARRVADENAGFV